MREIKFRAWDVVHEKIIGMSSDKKDKFSIRSDGWPSNDNYILMQYTGLKDKNGVEIFEGDVVKVTYMDREDWISVVEWDTVNPCFVLKRQPERFGSDVEYDFVKCGFVELQVVGNIHENVELLGDLSRTQ